VRSSGALFLGVVQKSPTPTHPLPAETQASKSYKEMPHLGISSVFYFNSILSLIKKAI
jgi:hypothetical protein